MIDIEKVKSRILTIRENVAKIKQYTVRLYRIKFEIDR